MSASIIGFGIGLFVGVGFGMVLMDALQAGAREDARMEQAIREDMYRVDLESREIAAEYRRREAMRAQSLNRRAGA